MMLQQPTRVPFFTFKDAENGVDEEASKDKGYQVPKLTTFILITPHGHRGEPMEFVAEDFLERKTREANEGRYDAKWVEEFKTGFELYKKGNEIPRHGMPLRNWERLTKARRNELATRFPTVEDLAAVPDSGLFQIGLDGRVLRDLAQAEIQAKRDLSPIVKELADAKEENRRLSDQVSALMQRIESLEEDRPKRGRPRLENEAV